MIRSFEDARIAPSLPNLEVKMSSIVGADYGGMPYEIIAPVIVSNPTRYLVALTFDDGPHPEHTKTILDVLDENDSHGTFFVIGEKISENSELISDALDRGHEFYGHSWNHPVRNVWTIQNYTYYVDQIIKPHNALKNIKTEPIRLFRAPGGSVSNPILYYAIQNLGFAEIHWSIDPKDWQLRDTQKIIDATLNNRGKPRTFFGEIVLSHDIYKETADAMKTVIPRLRSAGYELVTISELAKRTGNGFYTGARYKKFTPPRNAPL